MKRGAREVGLLSQVFVYSVHVAGLIVALVYDTPLRRYSGGDEVRPFYIVGVSLLFSALFVAYWLACHLDPGYLDREQLALISRDPVDTPSSGWTSGLAGDSMPGNATRIDYCEECDFYRPLRARHCRSCERCVARYDHHCAWIGQCLGERNQWAFISFLVLEAVTLIYGAFQELIPGLSPVPTWFAWANANFALLMFLVIDLGFLAFVLVMLATHLYLMLTNQTTFEVVLQKRGHLWYLRDMAWDWFPFDQGGVVNASMTFRHFGDLAGVLPLTDWTAYQRDSEPSRSSVARLMRTQEMQRVMAWLKPFNCFL